MADAGHDSIFYLSILFSEAFVQSIANILVDKFYEN
jgi:hypothetical protein